VTFDDGYRDNFVCAFPILKELGIPATIFLVSGHIESGQMPWYDIVRLAFKLTTRPTFSMENLEGPSGALKNALDRLSAMENTLLWLRRMSEPDRRSAIPRLFCELGVPTDLSLPNQMLRWDDIRQMSKQGISFGAHTVTHPVLSNVSSAQLRAEITESKRAIEQRLQRPVLHFAYPFGHYPDFSAEAKQFVRTAGYKTAATAVWGVNEPGSDLFELRRFTPWDSDTAEFRLKLDWYRLRELRVAGEEMNRRCLR
jgi:peptidoglycan/xylan/chitin deacetylase (PgdA/CDA1 family)